GLPAAPLARGADSWKEVLDPLGTRNLGFGYDRVENVLWRVYHDELDGYQASKIYIMIGTNNLGINTDEEIVAGLKLLVTAIRQR
ncbi:acetylhydrolase, partial [Pseudoxanthomonas sp. KAs_5_3]